MNNEKEDRRVKYTKNALKEALISLIQHQHISSISVKALCELADVNRSTFYVHYKDPYDLLHQMEEEVIHNVRLYLEKQEFDNKVPGHVLTSIFAYAQENSLLFQVLLSENSDYLFQKDIIDISQIVSSQYNKTLEPRTKDYLKEFGIAGCISIFQKWLKDGMPETSEEMSELIVHVLQEGMSSFQ